MKKKLLGEKYNEFVENILKSKEDLFNTGSENLVIQKILKLLLNIKGEKKLKMIYQVIKIMTQMEKKNPELKSIISSDAQTISEKISSINDEQSYIKDSKSLSSLANDDIYLKSSKHILILIRFL